MSSGSAIVVGPQVILNENVEHSGFGGGITGATPKGRQLLRSRTVHKQSATIRFGVTLDLGLYERMPSFYLTNSYYLN